MLGALRASLFPLILASFAAFAGITMPDDGPYFRVRRHRMMVIYDAQSQEAVEQVAAYVQAIRANYDQSFHWKLDEDEDLVLLSSRNQVANAYATIIPNIKSVWYPSGSGMLEDMAESSWALTLATHETSHLYQLNSKGPFPAALKTVFGNAPAIQPFIPIYIHPNLFTPTFLIEGNAVLNESRANIGGRLHSGEARALVLAQIKAGDIDPNRLINNEWRFPYGENPYLQGAYFQAHLAAKYGVDKTNQFFLAQGNHFLWPLILNKTFRDHFGASYPQEIREYVREMDALAKNQKSASGSWLLSAEYIAPLNHDRGRIFFLAGDGIEQAKLYSYDKGSHRLTSQAYDLTLGKVFWVEGHPESVDSVEHDLHHIEYSLYGEHMAFDPRYRSQIVNDIRAGKVAALDGTNSWLEPRVLINGETYDVGHSQPILDEQGNVYYFRQNGNERVLFKNRQPVFKFDGFYAKVTEVAEDGTIYFIASTDYGSTLYQYRGSEISRVFESDVVVDARQVSAGEFLVTEVTANGHELRLAQAQTKPAQPATYSYGFPSYNLIPAKIRDAEQTKSDQRPYNSLREMRYSSLDFASGYDDSSGLSGLIGANFADPLEFQTLNLVYADSQFRQQDALVRYTYTRFLPQFFVQYLYDRDFWKQHDSVERHGYNQTAQVGVDLPVLRWQQWDADVSVAGAYHQRDNHQDLTAPAEEVQPKRRREETYGADSGANLHYEQDPSPGLSMYPLRSFDLQYLNRLEFLDGSGERAYNTSSVHTQFEQGLPWQFYATLAGTTAWAETHDVLIDYNPYALTDDMRVARIAPHDYYTVRSATAARFELTKVFNLRGYSPRIPVGLDRLAPLLVAQGIFLDNDGVGYGRYPANISEWGYGVDLQILLLHLAHAKVRLLQGYDTRHPDSPRNSAQFSLNHSF